MGTSFFRVMILLVLKIKDAIPMPGRYYLWITLTCREALPPPFWGLKAPHEQFQSFKDGGHSNPGGLAKIR
jgi:hypothetical protein